MKPKRWCGFRLCAILVLLTLMAGSGRGFAGEADAPSTSMGPAAEEPAEAPQELSPELKMVLDHLDEANKQLKDVTARVEYVRAIPLLDEKERTKGGRLTFKKPDRVALSLGRPRNEEVYTNGKTWWVVSRNEKQVEVYRSADQGGANSEAAFLQVGYGEGSAKLLEKYHVALLGKSRTGEDGDQPETRYRLKFTPLRKEDASARYAAIEVELSDRNWLPRQFVLYERNGEITHTYTLSKVKTNTDVADKVFEYTPPGEYAVVDMSEK